jgi:urease alpha subunit
VLDLVITNALVIDWSGIFKADIGVKNSKIVGIGKAGNPDTMDNVTEGMIVGSNTEVSGIRHVVRITMLKYRSTPGHCRREAHRYGRCN